MPPAQLFTRNEVLRIAGVKPGQLAYWERLRLIGPRGGARRKVYTFSDLISLRTVKQLTEQRVHAGSLRRAIQALGRDLSGVEVPLAELRIVSNGRQIAVEYEGRTVEPLSGQMVLNFETRTLDENVRTMPERNAEEWFALALECEEHPDLRPRAIDAYRHVLERKPSWVEPRLNLGTLLYERGDAAGAAAEFRQAVELAPSSALAHFNLGTVLDRLGETDAALRHLSQAVQLDPDYGDAHYNLARVLEKLAATGAARRHWRRYLDLDPQSPWAKYARERAGSDRRQGE